MKNNKKLKLEDLMSLEEYDRKRPEFRKMIMAHKKNRIMEVGPHATMHFEDRLTMHYQVQEILKAERVSEPEGIYDELHAYNPLIPDGTNWKATFMIEYEDVEERKQALAKMIGIEDRIGVLIKGSDPVWAIADEDLKRETDDKTSSVHFLRFEFSQEHITHIKGNAEVYLVIEHPAYSVEVAIPTHIRRGLLDDLS